MISPKNKRKELEHILLNGNFVKISNAIKTLRNEPPFTGAIELLVSLYDKINDKSIKNLVRNFLNDLKDQSLCREVVFSLKNDLKPETKMMVISSCWQSGLNYSEFSADFAELFLSGDYMTAIECFSVIEASAGRMPRGKKDEILRIIQERPVGAGDEKAGLLKELISILE
ncbi:MAG: hypothetical protein Q8868_08110 [Bacteroidota bacterium]|nr:hypothetical protein [Bacteroidota bacterium]